MTARKKSTKTKPEKKPAKPARLAAKPAKLSAAGRKSRSIPSAPVLREVPAGLVVTTVTAKVDVGFGNLLHLRGEGPGLSWDRGIPMECVSADEWRIALGDSARPFLFKFLLNDEKWSDGPDFTVVAGESVILSPKF